MTGIGVHFRFRVAAFATLTFVLAASSSWADEAVSVRCLDLLPRLCLAPDVGDAAALVALVVPVGSASERDDEQGIAHYVEHLAFLHRKAVDGAVTPGTGPVDSFGNAFTTYGATIYQWQVPPQRVAETVRRALQVLEPLDVETHSALAERVVVKREREQRLSDPGARQSEQAASLLYSGTPLQHPIIGSARAIATMRLDTAVAFHRRHYSANTATMVVAGSFDANAVEALLEPRSVSTKSAPSIPVPLLEPRAAVGPVDFVDTFSVSARVQDLAVIAGGDNETTAARAIAAAYLTSSLPGAPGEALVRRRDDVGSAGFDLSQPVPGLFVLGAGMELRPGMAADQLDTPWAAWITLRDALLRDGIAVESFERLQKRLIDRLGQTRASDLGAGADLLEWLFLGGTVEQWRNYPQAVAQLDRTAVADLLTRFENPSRSVTTNAVPYVN